MEVETSIVVDTPDTCQSLRILLLATRLENRLPACVAELVRRKG